jgi:alpha-L-fucosidase
MGVPKGASRTGVAWVSARAGVVLVVLVLLCATRITAAEPAPPDVPETPAARDARMKWWRDARFGMFIHWGLYAVPAGTWQDKPVDGIGEWIMARGRIPVADYAAFAPRFNPVKFDADAWARLAKDAGMKYIVITSKHHDGFAMYPSKASPFNIADATPFKRDPIQELADACQRHGLRFGLYYSQAQDWHHPGGATPGPRWDPAQEGSMDEYLDKVAVPQAREILTNYPLDILWWDTPVEMTRERAEKFLPLLKLRPGVITNNRLGGGFVGDTETPEQHIPATGYPDGRDWETCMTMNDTWGFKSYDENWKSTQTLVRNLIDIASKGGNYLLNVGPTAAGEIPQPSVERLKEVGAWMRANGDAIYGTSAGPFKRYTFDGRATVKGERMYVHVFDWPSEGVRIVGLKNEVKSAKLLTSGDAVDIKRLVGSDTTMLVLGRPTKPDPMATVVVLELDGSPRVDPIVFTIGPEPDGSIRLVASDAEVVGKTARYESGFGLDNIGWWTDKDDHVKWTFQVPDPGRYAVDVTYACLDASAGTQFTVVTGASSVTGTVSGTGAWNQFKTERLGELDVASAGKQTLTVKPTTKPPIGVMNLREVRLTPATPATPATEKK